MYRGQIFLAALLCVICFCGSRAQELYPARHEQRLSAGKKEDVYPFSRLGQGYVNLKKQASQEWGLAWGADLSFTPQRVSAGGKQTAVEGVYYPYLDWTVFKDRAAGSGVVCFNYTKTHYWGASAGALQNRAGLAAAFNDSSVNEDIFSQLSYTHTLPARWNWLSVTAGQFPLSNFDGTAYLDNQQTSLMNEGLAQNASAAYPDASFGAYAQAQTDAFTVAAGYQDASNLSGEYIRLKSAFGGRYTAFASLAWTPAFKTGSAQYSVLYYYQPSVSSQPQNVNGWSFNAQQNIGAGWAVFARAGGSTGGAAAVKNSYAAGAAWLDPLERNPQDALIFGMAYNRLSRAGLGYPAFMHASEAAAEVQWVFGLGKFVTLSPDVQFYPRAALRQKSGPAVAAGLRTTVML